MKSAKTKAEKADALCRRACEQWEHHRYAAAMRLFHDAAKMGDTIAMHNLGYFYDVGLAGPKDRDLAMYWYLRAYRRGYSPAAINIGTIYRDEENYDRAFAWFNRAVALGDVSANFEIARVYIDWQCDLPKAMPYLRRVAKAKPYAEVSEWEWELASVLVDGFEAQHRRKYKRAPRRRRNARGVKLSAGA